MPQDPRTFPPSDRRTFGPSDPRTLRNLTFLTERPLSPNAGRQAGLLLLLLDALLLAAMWPLIGAFILLAVVCGLATSALLRTWNTTHPATVEDRARSASRFPEINIGAVNVGGDIGGFLFLCAAVLSILVGVPSLRWFVVGSLTCAGLAAALLVRMRRSGIYTRTALHVWRLHVWI
jgi:hypothetical protein